MGSWDHGVMGSWDHGIMGSWDNGIMGSWDHGIMGSWDHGIIHGVRFGAAVILGYFHNVQLSWQLQWKSQNPGILEPARARSTNGKFTRSSTTQLISF